MSFSLGGLASGLDTQALIEKLVAIERIPIDKLNSRIKDYDSQVSKFGTLKSKLSTLQDTVETLQKMSDALVMKATSTQDTNITATATGDAAPGTYTVRTTALAQAEKDRSQAFSSLTQQVKAGTLTITVKGGTPVAVTIAPGAGLQDVANAINASGAAVVAGVIFNGTSYYLNVTNKETGYPIGSVANDALILSGSYSGAGTALSFTQTQTAVNSSVTVDGLAIVSQTNTVTTAIPGVTLNLLNTMSSNGTIVVSSDTEETKANIQSFVDAYNDLMKFIDSELHTSESTNRKTTLAGDGTVRRIRQSLQSVISATVSGVSPLLNNLSQIGLATQKDGTLEVDDSKLTGALEKSANQVVALFATNTNGIADKLFEKLDAFTDPLQGTIKARTDGIADAKEELQDQIDRLELRVDAYEAKLVRDFTALETLMSQTQATGAYLAQQLTGSSSSK